MNANVPVGKICLTCAGSGEGIADGTTCRTCGGKGEVFGSEYECPECAQETTADFGPCPDCLNQMQAETP